MPGAWMPEVPGESEHPVNNAKLSLMRLNMPVLY